MADAHRIDPTVEGFGFCVFERVNNFGGVFFAKAPRCFLGAEIEVGECGFFEFEEVERSFAVPLTHKCLGDRFTNSFNVEGLARAEVRDACDRLGWALEVRAAPGDKTFFLRDGATTGWTAAFHMIEKGERL